MIKVMVVDDSSVVRQLMSELLSQTPDIEVIDTASDPIFAMSKMRHAWPDVIVLDIEMPRMDGITFLRQIMAIRPTPVILCSSVTRNNAQLAMEGLAAGAVGVMTKPALGIKDFLLDSADEFANAIRAAAQARPVRSSANAVSPTVAPDAASASPLPAATPHVQPVQKLIEPSLPHPSPAKTTPAVRPILSAPVFPAGPRLNADAILQAPARGDAFHPVTARIVAIGASTGGPQALEQVFRALSAHCPGVVVVQHMPEMFTRSFAERLDKICKVEVKEAAHGDLILPGRILIAPGGRHVVVRRDAARYFVEVVDGPLVSRHKPSVDVLFRSVAKAAGSNAVGIIMTGMGDDGACGLKEMAESGASTYAQDERSSIVFGMPKEAIQLGGVGDVISLEHISAVIEQYGFRESE